MWAAFHVNCSYGSAFVRLPVDVTEKNETRKILLSPFYTDFINGLAQSSLSVFLGQEVAWHFHIFIWYFFFFLFQLLQILFFCDLYHCFSFSVLPPDSTNAPKISFLFIYIFFMENMCRILVSHVISFDEIMKIHFFWFCFRGSYLTLLLFFTLKKSTKHNWKCCRRFSVLSLDGWENTKILFLLLGLKTIQNITWKSIRRKSLFCTKSIFNWLSLSFYFNIHQRNILLKFQFFFCLFILFWSPQITEQIVSQLKSTWHRQQNFNHHFFFPSFVDFRKVKIVTRQMIFAPLAQKLKIVSFTHENKFYSG